MFRAYAAGSRALLPVSVEFARAILVSSSARRRPFVLSQILELAGWIPLFGWFFGAAAPAHTALHPCVPDLNDLGLQGLTLPAAVSETELNAAAGADVVTPDLVIHIWGFVQTRVTVDGKERHLLPSLRK